MSTKLNAEELAAKRYPLGDSYIHPVAGWTKDVPKERDGYAAAIREVAQPIADQRDELLEALNAAYYVLMDGTLDANCDSYKRDARQKARAAIAKCTTP